MYAIWILDRTVLYNEKTVTLLLKTSMTDIDEVEYSGSYVMGHDHYSGSYVIGHDHWLSIDTIIIH